MNSDTAKEYPIEDIHIEQLTEFNAALVETFQCAVKDLQDFLRDDALTQQKEGVNITYLWLSISKKIILGYITMCCDTIKLQGEKKEEMKKIGIGYKSLPAVKIARMAVHGDFERHLLGTKMVAFATNIAMDLSNTIGCRYLTLEAKNLTEIEESKKAVPLLSRAGV